MNKEVIIAIIESIIHYDNIALGFDKSIHANDCSLCTLFTINPFISCQHPTFGDCPLTCILDPWRKIYIALDSKVKIPQTAPLEIWEHVEDEIELLISLLPPNLQLEFEV